jgi:hypothetical protein
VDANGNVRIKNLDTLDPISLYDASGDIRGSIGGVTGDDGSRAVVLASWYNLYIRSSDEMHLGQIGGSTRYELRIANHQFDIYPRCIAHDGIYVEPYLTVGGNLNVTGTKNFVQDHPWDPTKEIVYTSLEGGEAGVYTRGTAKLTDGRSIITLPEHFGWVTSSKGLTVQVTPRGDCNGLYVESITLRKLVVKELQGGRSNVEFDYLIQGIRKGYEDHEVIRTKKMK